jgi:hypothetical protein
MLKTSATSPSSRIPFVRTERKIMKPKPSLDDFWFVLLIVAGIVVVFILPHL